MGTFTLSKKRAFRSPLVVKVHKQEKDAVTRSIYFIKVISGRSMFGLFADSVSL